MNIIHYAGISRNQSSGVSVIVPEIINAQSVLMTVCIYNYGKESFHINEKVLYLNDEHNDDYRSFPEPFNKPDLVVFHSPFGLKKCIHISKNLQQNGIPYVIVPHGCFSKTALAKKKIKKYIAMNFILKNMFKKASAVQFLSEGEKSASVFSDKAVIIPNGITFPSKITRNDHQLRINISYIGRKDIYHKGLDLLIAACGLVKEQLERLNVIIGIYGPYDGENVDAIKELISQHRVENIVFDCLPVYGKDKADKYLNTDVLVLTSRSEGLPGVVLEAWSYGCPTLLTPGTNLADEAVKNSCGWKTEADAQSIANSLVEICQDRKEIYTKSSRAIKYVKKAYNWSNIAEKYAEFYEDIIKRYDSTK